MAIDADYVSPSVRWALLIEDHPTALVSYELHEAADVDIPAEFRAGSARPVCVATITFDDGRHFVGYREVDTLQGKGNTVRDDPRTPEGWNNLCTRALGRACKRAGYPSNLAELRQLASWRLRMAEARAAEAGRRGPRDDLLSGPPAGPSAAVPPPMTGSGTPGPPEAQTAAQAAEESAAIKLRLDALPEEVQHEYVTWCQERSMDPGNPKQPGLAWLEHLEAKVRNA